MCRSPLLPLTFLLALVTGVALLVAASVLTPGSAPPSQASATGTDRPRPKEAGASACPGATPGPSAGGRAAASGSARAGAGRPDPVDAGRTVGLAPAPTVQAESGRAPAPRVLWRVDSDPRATAGLAAAGGDAFALTRAGEVIALDAATGAARWRTWVDAGTGLIAAGDAVYVGGADGYARALDAATGAERWRFPAVAAPATVPTVSGGLLVVASGSSAAAPLLGDGLVYADGGERVFVQVVTVDTGAECWRAALAPGRLHALEAATGRLRWSRERQGPVVAAAVAGGVVVAEAGALYRLDAITGQEAWRLQTPSAAPPTLAAGEGSVFVTGLTPGVADGAAFQPATGWLLAVDAASGRAGWRFLADGPTLAGAAESSGAVYVAGRSGGLVALDPATGAVRWRWRHGASLGPPVPVGGAVLVGDGVGSFYALGAP